ncbi:MAG TPA: hypothetical protein PLY73_06845, partial [Candidatus Ozemobacteraceae bacterium]|nr:hypothetical protein [Candidatus Ozemobacteraceae bacterium]
MAGMVGSARLGSCSAAADDAFARLRAQRIVERIWKRDFTVWKPEPAEIANRLGWLDSPEVMEANLPAIRSFAEGLKKDGFTDCLLLGMGGSSLAPEVFRKVFGVAKGFLDLHVLDSTDPGAVLSFAEGLDPKRTVYIVSTKSGGTVETFSFLKYFYGLACDRLGEAEAGRHFAAITDPGSAIAQIAADRHFRAAFLNDPDIGGRYSALSYFGLAPAALLGVDAGTVLARAKAAASVERNEPSGADDLTGARLGAILGTLAGLGRDKVQFFLPPEIASFGDWVEQLIAESTGKEGKGILPIVGETPAPPDAYGSDRLFVFIGLGGAYEKPRADALVRAGHPVVEIVLPDRFDLGAQYFQWEIATAVACHVLSVNPFDQPNVEAAKKAAREMMAVYRKAGAFPPEQPDAAFGDIAVYGAAGAKSPGAALSSFLQRAAGGSYAAIMAYVRPSTAVDEGLSALRARIRDRRRIAVTAGYGPRFLHSTG